MSIIQLVDDGNFTKLFLEELGWNVPNQNAINVSCTNGKSYDVDQVAEFKGMGVWVCKELPEPQIQREIDAKVAAKTTERLILFTDGTNQEWRWPRYRANQRSGHPTLVPQRHVRGVHNPQLVERLEMIQIPFEASITVPELLHKMRSAFDTEAEIASRGAARLMGDLYQHLETSGMDDEMSSIFLARMLFLMFGDDTEMWSKNIFYNFISQGTKPDGSDLIDKLNEMFVVADTDIKDRPASIDPLLTSLPYINGGIFASPIDISASEPAEFRESLISASKFDWSQISPAVFGSMFQTVKSREDRRSLGEHYTSEVNILKALRPLFLDDLNSELDSSWDKPKDLEKLREKLAHIKVLDPACGCGNFLIVAYRELREIELEILKRLRDIAPIGKKEVRGQQATDATIGLNVTVEQFYGIEIESWPARIAETAMFLVDHQANVRMEGELGGAPRRLPIDLSPHIHLGSALTVPWDSLVDMDENTYIVGNPPYLGSLLLDDKQKLQLKTVWKGNTRSGLADLVTGWFLIGASHAQKYGAKSCFVSTNSITQGEQVELLWSQMGQYGVCIDFAHRTFKWMNEAFGVAAVHVVIIGFSHAPGSKSKKLWSYSTPSSEPELKEVERVNAYLVEANDILVSTRQQPLSSSLPSMFFGSMPRDGGNLSKIEPNLAAEVMAQDPIAAKYLHLLIGADELIKGKKRYCLWLEGITPNEIESSPFIRERVELVAQMRLASTAISTRRMATTPHLFAQLAQPKTDYIAVPSVSSERREYVPMAYFNAEVIASNALLTVPGADLATFALLMSRTFNTWIAAVSGRLKSDYRISQEITYNNFPVPKLTGDQRNKLSEMGQKILDARLLFPEKSLADLYDPDKMPQELLNAHLENDAKVLEVFDLAEDSAEDQILARLFALYQKMTEQQTANNSLFD